jgi:hypothetical protein
VPGEQSVSVLWMCDRKAVSAAVAPSENDSSLRDADASISSMSISSRVTAGNAGHEFAHSSSELFWHVPECFQTRSQHNRYDLKRDEIKESHMQPSDCS